jgi:CSLREA domain-containing protein
MHASTPFRARQLRHVLIAAMFVLALLPSPRPAYAATFVVDNVQDFRDGAPGDGICGGGPGFCSLRAAIQEANATSAQDTINVPAGAFNLDDISVFDTELAITKNLIINGAGAKTVIDGGGRSRVIRIEGAVVTLRDLTIRDGDAESASADSGEGGGIFNDGTLTLERVAVTNSTAFRGGGIWNDSGASLTLRNVTIGDNTATIDVSSGGGGIYNEGMMVLENVVIDRNKTGGAGGGIFNEQNSQGTLTDVIISRNVTTERSGGGISNEAIEELTLNRVSIFKNRARNAGGGIRNFGTLKLTNVTISGNSVSRKETFIPGGGGLRNSGYATLTNVTIANNSAVRGS